MLEPEVESRPWDEQLVLDDASYRTQLAYLLERSAFYRGKLELRSADEAGGLDDIGSLPLTEKTELKATTSAENPVGAHLCASPSEIVRIYSTSGTTGTPSRRIASLAATLSPIRRMCSGVGPMNTKPCSFTI